VSGNAQLAQAILRLLVAGKSATHVAALDRSARGNMPLMKMSEDPGDTGVEEAWGFAVAKLVVFAGSGTLSRSQREPTSAQESGAADSNCGNNSTSSFG